MNIYLCYFDSLGFETIIDCTGYEKRCTWNAIKGVPPPKLPVSQMIMRAKANPQRFPEIWTFQSEVDIDILTQYTKDNPQGLVDLIREHGSKVYVTPKEKVIIR